MKYLLVILGLVVLVLSIDLIRIYTKFRITKVLIAESKPFSFAPAQPDKSILIAGDSTAVGTGVMDPIDSIAGRFHKDFPNAQIVNVAHNGYKIAQIQNELQHIDGKFDLVLLQAGANDILFFTPLPEAQEDLRTLIDMAKERGSIVLLLTSGNIGIAPIFWPPVSWFYSWRTQKFHEAFAKIAQEKGIIFVQLYKERAYDPFAKDEAKFYAADGSHLTGAGYEYWYAQIRTALGNKFE
jgi:lysophospholipase L1-like esterase